jgi:UDP-GlcNAc:undecaprenyl-phosphate/decaprenyl-phosphate GlcNAc-1-phosphate transferase
MLFLTTLLISIIITIAAMPHTRELAVRFQALDRPNSRKVHAHVMPRCGGLAMAVGICVPILLWAPKTNFVKGLLVGAVIIVLFGLADDIKDLRASIKLLGQTLAALVVTLVGGVKINDISPFWTSGAVLPDWAAIPLTLFVIVGVTNATNLADGLDGLAGGIALLIFLCIGYFGVIGRDWVTVMVAVAVGGSVLGFLRFNSYPAQLFMGDAGSQLLGFMAIVLSIKMAQQSAGVSTILPLIIFGIPILDTITVMIKRLATGRSPFSADRNHFHHRLIKMGLFHTEAVLAIYAAQALLIIFAITYHDASGWFLLCAYLLFAGGVLGVFHITQKADLQLSRDHLNAVKSRMKQFKDRGEVVKLSFGIVKVAFPALLVFNALFQPKAGSMSSMFSSFLLFIILLAWLFDQNILHRISKTAFYLFTPFIIFKCDLGLQASHGPLLISAYNTLYLLLLGSVLLTMKLTRRSNGFKNSTMDFLVIFLILMIPNLPGVDLTGHLLGLVAVKTVILYYSYEVLVGEMRRTSFNFTILATVLIFWVKGGLGFV